MRTLNLYKTKAYRASKYNFQSLRPSAFLGQDISPKLIRLSEWCKQNNYTPEQARRLIRKNYLYAMKQNGIIWVSTCYLPDHCL